MERAEILAVLETPDDLLEIDLLTDDEVEEILKKNGNIWAQPAFGALNTGQGACCEGPQYDSGCLTNFSDGVCISVWPGECGVGGV